MPKITVADILAKKKNNEKITCLTAYDFPTAKILDGSGVDIILVGDSLGNVVLGLDGTKQVSIEDMVHHVKAAGRAVKNALLAADMPLSSFSADSRRIIADARRLFEEAGAEAVKIEGDDYLKEIQELVNSGIPVIGHLGYLPQTAAAARITGKTCEESGRLLESARLLAKAGVFAIVLELVDKETAAKITSSVGVPTIGIGSGPNCDGQVLVTHDIVGLTQGKVPGFVKQYADLGSQFRKAVSEYMSEVKEGKYPPR